MFDHWNAHHAEPELWQLAEEWGTEPRPGWAHADDILVEWLHDAPDKALAFMCTVLQSTQDTATVSFLAAGPLEDLLCIHGEAILDTVRTLAHEHDEFRVLVSGVWRNSMSKVLYQKVRAIGVGRL